MIDYIMQEPERWIVNAIVYFLFIIYLNYKDRKYKKLKNKCKYFEKTADNVNKYNAELLAENKQVNIENVNLKHPEHYVFLLEDGTIVNHVTTKCELNNTDFTYRSFTKRKNKETGKMEEVPVNLVIDLNKTDLYTRICDK